MMVIMFGGKARVGKTTLAKWFSKYMYNKGFSPTLLSFADILKREVAKTGLTKEDNPEEYRLACQVLGSGKRKQDPDYWLTKFNERLNEIKVLDIENLETSPRKWHEKCVIVDDCRYLNEVGYGRKIDALNVFIAHGDRKLSDHDAKWREHESEDMANKIESWLSDYQNLFHFRLFNDTTEEAFKKKAESYFDDWLDYLQSDDKKLCDCFGCMKFRHDIELTQAELDKLALEAFKRCKILDNNEEL